MRTISPTTRTRPSCAAGTRHRLRTQLLLLLVLGVPALAPAQNLFAGLSSLHSTLFGEREQEGFAPGENDRFGSAFVAADFSGDGRAELVTGIPGDDCDAVTPNCGAVFLSWGNPAGLIDQGGFLWAGAPGSPRPPHEGDKYGAALAAGDFNGDGLADLVIGVPNGQFFAEPGNVQIHFGLPGWIQPTAEQLLRPGAGGVPDDGLEADDRNARFGGALATGDFNGDGHDDLAIGAPTWIFHHDGGGDWEAGAVVIAEGHIGGLLPYAGYLIAQGREGIPDETETGDHFGQALAAGDFNGDGFDDLAIGVPDEDSVGAVLVLFGSPNSLIFANHYWLGEFDLGGQPASGDLFGSALAAADFNRDGFEDLAIGAWGDDGPDGLEADMGLVALLYGAQGSPASGGGFQFDARQWIREDDFPGGGSDPGDAFGFALTAGDFDGDGFDDLVIGTPREFSSDYGAAYVAAGGATLLGARRSRLQPRVSGLPGPPAPEAGAQFGYSLCAGDFDGDHFDDLVVGLPVANYAGFSDSGSEIVIYGSLFSDGFESSTSTTWSSTQP